jgi:hypothetical protein
MIKSSPDSLNGALETSYIRDVLFQGEAFNVGLNYHNEQNKTIIYLELFEINQDLIEHSKKNLNKIILYHMGDELGQKDKKLYSSCDFVIRNYFFDEFISEKYHPNIIWAPNGYRTGVGPRASKSLKRVTERNAFASFLGWIDNSKSFNNERFLFVEAAKKCQEKIFFLATNGFAGGYSVGLYSAIMEDSIFAPCPAGNSPETIRLYDALELGCIPISLRHDFLSSQRALAAIGLPPFPLLNSWHELPIFLQEMNSLFTSNPNMLLEMQKQCINWWGNYKIYISKKISDKISTLN